MKSLWSDAEAARYQGDLGLRVYTSRLLGRDGSLVLHGGGNTSVKTGRAGPEEMLHVKGTGSDLARVEEVDFTPLRLAGVLALFDHPRLSNADMMRLLAGCALRSPAPRPSIETMLHAALPFRYVEHTHADSVLAVANVEHGDRLIAAVYGELAPGVAYHHSGVELARACRDAFQRHGTHRTIGLILRFHGVVAFGESARASYENMLRLASMAEDFLKARNAWEVCASVPPLAPADQDAIDALRAEVSRIAGRPLAAHCARDALSLSFARRDDLDRVSQQGPATPQHALFTRRVPLVGRDVAGFARRYREYLERHLGAAAAGAIDAAPRIALDPELGLCAFGDDPRAAATAAEIYRHDIEIISRASAHGAYRAAPEGAIALAELEYGGHAAPP